MASLAKVLAEEARGSLPRENMGLPSLDLMDMQGIDIPSDYDITGVLGDIIMCEIIDETNDGEVMRDGIIMKRDVVGKMWRVAKVAMTGPQCPPEIKVGDCVFYPSDKGLPMIRHHKKYVFLNAPRIFAIVKPLYNT